MPVLVVVGAQWGDEGKGKIIDILSEKADVVARYQGGHNAGHTVVIGGDTFILHLIPTGILHNGKRCIIGNGVVVDPTALIDEIEGLQKRGINVSDNLFVSKKAHVIMPYHQICDRENEMRMGSRKIGTTGRGIGPGYSDKMSRVGIRMEDMLDEDVLKEKLKINIDEKNRTLKNFYNHAGFQYEMLIDEFMKYSDKIACYISDTTIMLRDSIQKGENILCEGAQGTMLDIDHGTYPYVTSSNTISAGACTGLGIAPNVIDRVLGVAKAYTTRVGDGPFPTELNNDNGDMLRSRGKEFGSTTGRSRRCGWFDAVAVKYSKWLNGFDSIAITKLDVLDNCNKLYICTAYQYKNDILTEMPSELQALQKCKPVYKEIDGWMEDTAGITSFKDLPGKTKKYIDEIAKYIEKDISIISTGQKRDETIIKEDIM